MLRVALLNPALLDFDRRIDFSALRAACDLSMCEGVTPAAIPEVAAGHDAIITKEIPVETATVDAMRSVRLVVEAGTGFNNIALEAARRRGIVVCNVPGYSTKHVAQLTASFLTSLASGTLSLVRAQAATAATEFAAAVSPVEVAGKTLGVVGAGAIGAEVARLARAHEMNVLTTGRSPRHWPDPGMRHTSLRELLAASDFVTLHCPLVNPPAPDATRHLVRAETLALMKPTAWLVNTSRGPLVHTDDLVAALQNGVLAGAALDVQDPEPPPRHSPLWRLPNVFLTPHVGWKSVEARQRLVNAVADNIRAFAAGRPTNVVA